ncbi:hypothetical protein [Clostridium sp.]|uniref:hypothetical protein n=1 Tax=Clostridium sp. TaxID=1506 RepID=UPI0032163980
MKWKVEDLKLYNQKSGLFIGKEKIYECESEVIREEKISFVDSFQDNKLSYLIDLIDKFNKDKEALPKDNCGYVKTVSLKAWINRNDTKYERKIVDNRFSVGEYNLLGTKRNIKYDYKGTYDTYKDLVDELFHRQLKECAYVERKWFLEHDEYSILKEKFRRKKYNTTFGVDIGECSNGDIYVYDKNSDNERDITIDELTELLAKYEELDKLVEKLTAETNIKY